MEDLQENSNVALKLPRRLGPQKELSYF